MVKPASPIGEIRCPACRFGQRRVAVSFAAIGLGAVSHRCENRACEKWMVILYSLTLSVDDGRARAHVVGVRPRLGRDEQAMRRTFAQFPELQGDRQALETLVAVGLQLGSILSTPRPGAP